MDGLPESFIAIVTKGETEYMGAFSYNVTPDRKRQDSHHMHTNRHEFIKVRTSNSQKMIRCTSLLAFLELSIDSECIIELPIISTYVHRIVLLRANTKEDTRPTTMPMMPIMFQGSSYTYSPSSAALGFLIQPENQAMTTLEQTSLHVSLHLYM